MDIVIEWIVGVCVGLENVLDDELGSIWIINLGILRLVFIPHLPLAS